MISLTDEQKFQIEALRLRGTGYSAIADALGLSKDTVKSYCKRNKMGGVRAVQKTPASFGTRCPQCGREIAKIPGRKARRFDTDACRQAWWNAHQDQVARKAIYAFTCSGCGRKFSAYGNSHRKYCCHECYVKARFGAGDPA